MAETFELTCPSPTCPSRMVETVSPFSGPASAEVTSRSTWESRWLGATADAPGEAAQPECPDCGTEGVDSSDDRRLEEAEEELGRRCESCGVVTANPDGGCPYCGEAFPEQQPPDAPPSETPQERTDP